MRTKKDDDDGGDFDKGEIYEVLALAGPALIGAVFFFIKWCS